MTILTPKFTPEVLITAPRRSGATPNSRGTHALYTVSTYSLDSHSETKEVKVLNLNTGNSTLFSDDERTREPNWLLQNQVIWVKSADGGATELWIGTAGEVDKNAYLAGSIPAPIGSIKTKELPGGDIAIAFTAAADTEGALYNPEKAEKPRSSGREYESMRIRFWDTYWPKERSSLWYTTLERSGDSKYRLSKNAPVNALKGTGIVFPSWLNDPLSSPNFDISVTGLVLTAIDPEFDFSYKLNSNMWYLPLCTFTESPAPRLHKVIVPGYDGSSSGAVFSPNGKACAFLRTKKEQGMDHNRVFVVGSVEKPENVIEIAMTEGKDKDEPWDRSPDSITWSNDAQELYLIVSDRGRGRVFKVPVKTSATSPITTVPVALSDDGVVSSVFPLSKSPSDKRLFVNKTSMIDSSIYALIDPSSGSNSIVSSATNNGSSLGLRSSQVSEFTVKGQDDYDVHSWVMKPSNFDKNKKYPLAFMVHGGPAGSWSDAWSTRWNYAVYAEQGYVVVLPNPTGSTGWGLALAEGVEGEWGGRVYNDLVNCFSYVEKNMPYVDLSRSVALGASFGGYSMCWMAGQPLAKKFKTLVCHDGIFSTYNMLSSDVSQMLQYDFGKNPWDKGGKKAFEKHDPAQYTDNWTQPMLIIHSENDYRCPVTEGLAAFNVCQMRGIESRYLSFPDENHFVLKRENSLHWHHTVLGWINKFAGVKGGVELRPPVTEPGRKQEELAMR